MGTATDRIIRGDCIQGMNELPAGSVDLAFADPPFNIGYDYDHYDDRQADQDYLAWSHEWMAAVHRVLKPDGTYWLAIGDEYAAELKVLATRWLGFTCRSWVVWYYTFGVHCQKKFTRSHAHLFHFVKDAKRFTFNVDEVRVPSARQLVYGDKRAHPTGRVPDDTWIVPGDLAPLRSDRDATVSEPAIGRVRESTNGHAARRNRQSTIDNQQSATGPAAPRYTFNGFVLRPQDLPGGFSPDSDTWYFPRVCGTFKEREGFHGCQMPEQLLGRIIRACSNEGDLVLDPFAGSGTTLAVAKKLGRRCVGFELSPHYAKEATARLKSVRPGQPLDGAEDPLSSVPETRNGTVRTADGRRYRPNGRSTKRASAVATAELF